MSDTMEEKGVDDAQEQAAFGSGFEGDKAEKPTGKIDTPDPATSAREKKPEPEFVQLTKDDLAALRAAAAEVSSLKKQQASAFGTIGNLKTAIDALKSRGGKIEISKEAFAEMEKDFPELANSTRAALEKALAGISGTGSADVDDEKLTRMLATLASAREVEALEDAYPDWRTLVGAVGKDEAADPKHPFRAWLATKDATYQARINGTESAAVISRAIDRFQTETKATAKPPVDPKTQQRTDRIRAAVQPKGDGGAPAASNTREDAFAAGFGS